jgi:chromosomal replication initiation ATPase DnaA
MTGQIPLLLPVEPAFGEDDFMVTPSNADAARITREHQAGTLLLLGPSGSGKSHLAAIWGERMQARPPEWEQPAQPATLWEDADKTDWNDAAQKNAFHLLNSVKESGAALLVTAATPPAQWPLTLADLRSRLLALPVAQIQAPDDGLTAGLLLKHLGDRQLRLSEETLHYLIPRLPRDGGRIAAIVAQLDEAALTQKRAITVPFIREQNIPGE